MIAVEKKEKTGVYIFQKFNHATKLRIEGHDGYWDIGNNKQVMFILIWKDLQGFKNLEGLVRINDSI